MVPAIGSPTATLVAIAKNEGPYLLEWIAHHLAIGFTRILVYDNESSDDTRGLLTGLSARWEQIDTIYWPSANLHLNDSPQTTAYNHALKGIWTDWVMFLDIDEYLVPHGDGSLQAFLQRVPDDAASVHINWMGFGSSGLTAADYGFVTQAFTRCAHPLWGNNHHFKSIARADLVERAHIHNVDTKSGRRLLSDLSEFTTVHNGASDRIVHEGIQINHYQCKTFVEFEARMRRGDANYHPRHDLKARDHSLVRFGHLDVNYSEDHVIEQFRAAHLEVYERLRRCIP